MFKIVLYTMCEKSNSLFYFKRNWIQRFVVQFQTVATNSIHMTRTSTLLAIDHWLQYSNTIVSQSRVRECELNLMKYYWKRFSVIKVQPFNPTTLTFQGISNIKVFFDKAKKYRNLFALCYRELTSTYKLRNIRLVFKV